MAKTSPRQRKSIGRVMHEFKHGELKSGPGGRAGKVKNPRQAVAIALHEAGASQYESPAQNRRSLKRTERKEARGETAQQEAEGKSHVGARGRSESSPAMRGNSRRKTAKAKRHKAPATSSRAGRKRAAPKHTPRKRNSGSHAQSAARQ